ncbi:MAG: YeeE/YedE thiosulfate transporter family protein [Vicinamibacterales bacterium]
MPLILHGLQPMHWALAGGLIALVTLTLLLVGNRRLGISSGLEDVCSLVLDQPFYRRSAVTSGRPWRLPFLAGLVLGGAASAVLGGGWSPTWALGMLDRAASLDHSAKLAWMFGGGILTGFGTRLANGCTSGHGIFGNSNFEWPSLVASCCFMASGVATTQIIYRVVLR